MVSPLAVGGVDAVGIAAALEPQSASPVRERERLDFHRPSKTTSTIILRLVVYRSQGAKQEFFWLRLSGVYRVNYNASMDMKEKKRSYDRHRAPRSPVQLPKEIAEEGKRLAAAKNKTFVEFLSGLIEAAKRKRAKL